MRSSGMSSLMGGPTEAKMEKFRSESRELRMDAMQALHQILTGLHSSIVEPMQRRSHFWGPSPLGSPTYGTYW